MNLYDIFILMGSAGKKAGHNMCILYRHMLSLIKLLIKTDFYIVCMLYRHVYYLNMPIYTNIVLVDFL
jgi:hypothetical protein